MKPIFVAVAACTLLGAGAPTLASDQHHSVVPADAIKWGPAPASLPPGAQAAVLLGHPTKEGPFVLRLKFPAGFVIPPNIDLTWASIFAGSMSPTTTCAIRSGRYQRV